MLACAPAGTYPLDTSWHTPDQPPEFRRHTINPTNTPAVRHVVARVLPRRFGNEVTWLHGTEADVADALDCYGDEAIVRPVSRHRTAAAAKARANSEFRDKAQLLKEGRLQNYCSVRDVSEKLVAYEDEGEDYDYYGRAA